MSTSGSDLTWRARCGMPLLIAQASSRSGSALTTFPYQPGPNRARSRNTSGASHKPPVAACRNPSARRSNQRGTSGGTNHEPGGIEGIERQPRLAAKEQVGDQLARDWRQQDAVAEVTGRDAQSAPLAKTAEHGQAVGRSGPQTRPGLDERGVGQPWSELHGLRQEAGDHRGRGPRIESDVFDGGSRDRDPVSPRQGIAVGAVDQL